MKLILLLSLWFLNSIEKFVNALIPESKAINVIFCTINARFLIETLIQKHCDGKCDFTLCLLSLNIFDYFSTGFPCISFKCIQFRCLETDTIGVFHLSNAVSRVLIHVVVRMRSIGCTTCTLAFDSKALKCGRFKLHLLWSHSSDSIIDWMFSITFLLTIKTKSMNFPWISTHKISSIITSIAIIKQKNKSLKPLQTAAHFECVCIR